MNFQHYETLLNKNKEKIKYYVNNIAPKLTVGELSIILMDIIGKGTAPKKNELIPGFIETGDDFDKEADLSKLSLEELVEIYKFFISRENNSNKAIKWRFYQYLKFDKDFAFDAIFTNTSNKEEEKSIDFIIKEEEGKFYFVCCSEILDLSLFNDYVDTITKFTNDKKIKPKKIILISRRTHRDIPINEPVKIASEAVEIEIQVEWIESKTNFNGDDLLIIQNNFDETLEVAGFNFSSIKDLLDYIWEFTVGGQISVYKQVGYFTDEIEKKEQVELIWKGIMIKA